MLCDSLFQHSSSLTYVYPPTLACYPVHNSLGVDGVRWGFDLRQSGQPFLKLGQSVLIDRQDSSGQSFHQLFSIRTANQDSFQTTLTLRLKVRIV